jgi:hypothetical protein
VTLSTKKHGFSPNITYNSAGEKKIQRQTKGRSFVIKRVMTFLFSERIGGD